MDERLRPLGCSGEPLWVACLGRVAGGLQFVPHPCLVEGRKEGLGGDDECGRHGQARIRELPEVRPLAACDRDAAASQSVNADHRIRHRCHVLSPRSMSENSCVVLGYRPWVLTYSAIPRGLRTFG